MRIQGWRCDRCRKVVDDGTEPSSLLERRAVNWQVIWGAKTLTFCAECDRVMMEWLKI